MVGYSPKEVVDDSSDSADSSLDTVFGLLTNQRRRYALAYITDHPQPIALADVAKAIAVWENDVPVTEIPTKEIQAISISLHHHHLPRLADANVITFDKESNQIRASETAGRVRRALALATDGGNEQ